MHVVRLRGSEPDVWHQALDRCYGNVESAQNCIKYLKWIGWRPLTSPSHFLSNVRSLRLSGGIGRLRFWTVRTDEFWLGDFTKNYCRYWEGGNFPSPPKNVDLSWGLLLFTIEWVWAIQNKPRPLVRLNCLICTIRIRRLRGWQKLNTQSKPDGDTSCWLVSAESFAEKNQTCSRNPMETS